VKYLLIALLQNRLILSVQRKNQKSWLIFGENIEKSLVTFLAFGVHVRLPVSLLLL